MATKKGGGAPLGNRNAAGRHKRGGARIAAVGSMFGPVGNFAAGAVNGATHRNVNRGAKVAAGVQGAVGGVASGIMGAAAGAAHGGKHGAAIGGAAGAAVGIVTGGAVGYGAHKLGGWVAAPKHKHPASRVTSGHGAGIRHGRGGANGA